jgi:RHS repeat-associated protein
VKDSSNNVLESFAYDGENRRVSSTANSTTTDLYYSPEWQVLEERVGGSTTMQYVWSPVYIDAMILRDRDTDANGSLDERLWVQQDANFNVTALVNGSGSVVERYAYDPFGLAAIYDASWGSRSSSSYAWVYLHQGLRYDDTATAYDNRRRWYDPALGRFMQNDPIGYAAGDVNLYRYVANDPVWRRDPEGLGGLTSHEQAMLQYPLPTLQMMYETGVITAIVFATLTSAIVAHQIMINYFINNGGLVNYDPCSGYHVGSTNYCSCLEEKKARLRRIFLWDQPGGISQSEQNGTIAFAAEHSGFHIFDLQAFLKQLRKDLAVAIGKIDALYRKNCESLPHSWIRRCLKYGTIPGIIVGQASGALDGGAPTK